MFQKVHLRLAALCAGITTVILLAMSLGYLYISEQGLRRSHFVSFQNDMNTVINNLEQQTIITHEWLTLMEDNGKYLINIIDNGTPFLYNDRNTKEQKQLFETAWNVFEQSYELQSTSTAFFTYHIEFLFSSTGHGGNDYYACVATSERKSGTFQVMLLCSMEPLLIQIRTQRLLFLILNVIAIFALTLFSFHFTKRILRPLEENQQQQNQFIASASHELRTPLAVILSCASALTKASKEEQAHFLESIQAEGLRMSRLIDDMLLLTKAGNCRFSIHLESTELDTLLLDTFEAFEPVASEKSIRLLVELPEDALPPIPCDRERIHQVLEILLHNAVSYTPEGGRIQLRLRPENRYLQILVSDTGIGIPDSEKEHIFERFYRADQSRSEKGHFGLGLSIASEIISAHSGQLLVSDTPGGGSTFTVLLPKR